MTEEPYRNNVNKEAIEQAISEKKLKIRKSSKKAQKIKKAGPSSHKISWSYDTATVTIDSVIRDQFCKDLGIEAGKDFVNTIQSYDAKNHIVTLKLVTANSLTAEQKKLLKDLGITA